MANPQIIGRYALYRKIASGGMATIHLGRLLGPVGFSRTVAIKRMHSQFTEDPEFVSMFLDEARLAARIRHPNVIPTLDVVATSGELFLVLEYVHGQTLARLVRLAAALGQRIPVPIAAAIASGVLHGLHAAHEAKNERGEALGIVHRDVSPQNVMVGVDGISRVLDFGVAKAIGRLQTTREGRLKGKLSYMAPEQLKGSPVSRRSDIYALSVVLWEVLTGRRLFDDDNEGAVLQRILESAVDPPSKYSSDVPQALDRVVLKGLARDPDERFATAREMANAIHEAVTIAITPVVGDWVEQTAAEPIAQEAAWLAEIESASGVMSVPSTAQLTTDVRSAVSPADVTDIATSGASLISQPSSISVATPTSVAQWVDKRRGLVVGGAALAFAFLLVSGFVVFRSFGAQTAVAPSMSNRAISAARFEPSVPATPAASATPDSNVVDLDDDASGVPGAASASGRDAAVPKPPTGGGRGQFQKPVTKKTPTSGYNPLEHL